MKAIKDIAALDDLRPDPANANLGTLRGEQLLEKSLESLGAGRAIVVDRNGYVIGGNKTLQIALEAGLGVRVVRTDGRRLVVVVRTDLDLAADPKARLLAYMDNRTAELGLKWDPARLEADLAAGIELGGMFSEDERLALLASMASDEAVQSDEDLATNTLRAELTFETDAQRAQWLRAVEFVMGKYDRPTFPDRLEQWLTEQMEALGAD